MGPYRSNAARGRSEQNADRSAHSKLTTEKMEKSENPFDLCKIKSSKIVANAIGSIEQAMLRVVRSEQCLAINL